MKSLFCFICACLLGALSHAQSIVPVLTDEDTIHYLKPVTIAPIATGYSLIAEGVNQGVRTVEVDTQLQFIRTFSSLRFVSPHTALRTADGGTVVSGTRATAPFIGTLLKLDSVGYPVWQVNASPPATLSFNLGTGAQYTSDSGFVATGRKGEAGQYLSVSLMRVRKDATLLWEREYRMENFGRGIDVQQTPDGGFLVLASDEVDETKGAVWLIRTNAQGDSLWSKRYGSYSEYPFNLLKMNDGNFVIVTCENYRPTGPSFFRNIKLYKIDPSGTVLWEQSYPEYGVGGVPVETLPVRAKIAQDGGILVAGTVEEDSTLSIQNSGVYVLKVGTSGVREWGMRLGTDFAGEGRDVVEVAGGYVVAGVGTDMNLGISVGYLAKLSGGTTAVEAASPLEVSISPNPFGDKLEIVVSKAGPLSAEVRLYNLQGQEVLRESPVAQGRISLDTGHLADGVYLVRISAGGQSWSQKVVKQ